LRSAHSSAFVSARHFVARAGAVAIALPTLFAGSVPASAAIASHVVTPAVANGVRYEFAGNATDGRVLFRCQTGARLGPPAPPFCYGPDQIRAAYNIQPVLDSGITGAGRTIVIIDAFQSPTIRQDLALFDHIWGYPDPTFNIIAPDGLTPFNPGDPAQLLWSSEISLDVQWAHAIAPGATIDLVLAKSDNDPDVLRVTRFAVDHNLGDVISQSFGEAEACAGPALLAQEHAVFEAATRKGITLFASSGDFGSAQPTCDGSSLVHSASTPASDPEVTGVGGTHLLADARTGAYGSESVWNDDYGASGGGFSTVYRRPGYQAPFQSNEKQRGVPDVAYNGDVRGGVIAAFGVPFGVGGLFVFGGTSAGSPQWAAIIALADQKGGHRLGAINKTLYHIAMSDAYSAALHDVTAGNNGFFGVPGFSAGVSWDAATGLGTPNAAKLIALLI
jgi:subtilase family serine protease